MSARRWRCFHCDEVFAREVDAREHFGGSLGALAGCQIRGHENDLLRKIREQQEELAYYRREDTDLLRALASLQSEAAERSRRAEEIGYGRGVREVMALAEAQFGAAVVV